MVAALAFLAAAGCHSLEVTNPNDPDVTRALSSGGDVQSLLGGGFRNWYFSLTQSDATLAWDVTADHYESAWGNWAMRYTGWEPRIYPYVNTHTDPNTWTPVGEIVWYNNYAAVVSANLVLKALAAGVAIPGPAPDSSDNPMIKAAAKFLQGVALSQVALAYDSGYALDENTDVTTIKLVGRDSVMRAALGKLNDAIALSTGTWTIPENFLGQTGQAWTATQLGQAANTYAARLIAYFPHNATENASADWAKVLSYASKGISSGTPFDAVVQGDGGNNWWNERIGYGEDFQIWMRTNFRTLCLLDNTYWCHRPNNGIMTGMVKSADRRFNGDGVVGDNCPPLSVYNASRLPSAPSQCTTASKTGDADFVYDSLADDWPGYPPARGYYRFSPVNHVRYWDVSWASSTPFLGPMPFLLAAENDLLWAEALVRTGGSFATAAAKINNSRVTRGHLSTLTGAESKDSLLKDIIYERAIELYSTGDRVAYYDARRWSADLAGMHYYTASNDSNQTGWTPYGTGLQPGSIRLWPVPAQELQLTGGTVYTFGGVSCTAPNSCTPTYPEPPAPPARPSGSAPVRVAGSIFGTAPDGRVITGPGIYNQIADSMFAAARRAVRYHMRTRL